MSLDFTQKEYQALLQQASDIVLSWQENLSTNKTYQNPSPEDIRKQFDEPLPTSPSSAADLLDQIDEQVYTHSNLNASPNYYGYITGGGNQTSVLAEMLKNALNQNNLKWHSAPANSEIEKIVVKWICQFIGYPESAGGVMVSGGSVANFLNLAVMRKVKCPIDVANEGMQQAPKMTVYASEQGHSSIDKGMDMLGLGKKYLRKIAVDENFQVSVEQMEQQIVDDKKAGMLPIGIVGMAGTTNSGAVDDLNALADLAEKYDLWYVVDAAYGGPAAATKLAGHLFAGIDRADSILINPHKWFYVPFEVACVIVKDKEKLRNTFSLVPDYLTAGSDDKEDLMDFNLQLTKDFKALKVWMTFKTYGADKLKAAIGNDISNAQYAAKLIEESDDFELLAPVPLSIVCFRYVGNRSLSEKELDEINKKLLHAIEADGRIFFAGTKINDKVSLRISLTNHRRTMKDIDYLFEVMRELAELNVFIK
ncbi:MAG: aminotransferase class I/II-fold pyridoxal phosphate-dependent enzyme [Reichenbachiella sp.]|uniref:pyridoxal phosphate-dependent decarboxylase family protein n=1 Tax=Reichenbachiella sp. TaxID=2184521 RepID=UPI0032976049